MDDIKFMKKAIEQARLAYEHDEVPIGCVIVYRGEVIAEAFNTVEEDKLAIAHAEINAIKMASKKIGDWRLDDCTMYVTKEPCAMCAGAISKSRIRRLVIGARDPKMGCAGSLYNLVNNDNFYHKVQVTYDCLSDECIDILQKFFREKRKAVD